MPFATQIHIVGFPIFGGGHLELHADFDDRTRLGIAVSGGEGGTIASADGTFIVNREFFVGEEFYYENNPNIVGTTIDVGDRNPADVWLTIWRLATHIDSLNVGYTAIPELSDTRYNSNSFVNTLLFSQDIDTADYLPDLNLPGPDLGYPGSGEVIDRRFEINGTVGVDFLVGGERRDTLAGFEGNDVISGGNKRDTLVGGQGDDILRGDDGNDLLYGDEGNNTIVGGTGRDKVFYDTALSVTLSILDIAQEDDGNILSIEHVRAGEGGLTLYTDEVTGVEVVLANPESPNTLSVSELSGPVGINGISGKVITNPSNGGKVLFENFDQFIGTNFDDTFIFDASTVTSVEGGDGVDEVRFNRSEIAVTLGNEINNVEIVRGSNFGDTIKVDFDGGDTGATIYGRGGIDMLIGSHLDDTLHGGAEADRLEGGLGFDTYILRDGDIILDEDGAGVLMRGANAINGSEQNLEFDWSGDPDTTLTITNANSGALIATVENYSAGDLGISLNEILHFDTVDRDQFTGTVGIVDRFVFDYQPTDFNPNGIALSQDFDRIDNFVLGEDIIDLSAYRTASDRYDFFVDDLDIGGTRNLGILQDTSSGGWRNHVSPGFPDEGAALRIFFPDSSNPNWVNLTGIDHLELEALDSWEDIGIVF